MVFNWQSLQNGSDIRGVATEGVPGEPVNLTPERVGNTAMAFVSWLADREACRPSELLISVGRDSRISGPALLEAFISGVCLTGARAIDCGLASTPAMFMSTVFEKTRCQGAVMLTASHLPFNRNGIKFFTAGGGLDKADISSILALAAGQDPGPAKKRGDVTTFDLIGDYAGFLADIIRREVDRPGNYTLPLLGFHIVVDAGNGSGGFFAEKVLKPLGADTRGSQFLDPDGRFPNHVPNPEDDAAMESLQRAVLENGADIGIIFDTDVDRAAIVDQSGMIINRNRLIALISAIVLEEHPGTAIVTDSITSDGLHDFITGDLGGRHHRFKRGYKNVINEALRMNREGNECWLAIETSGHAALRENRFLDDGAYLVTKILIEAARLKLKGKTLLQLTDTLRMPLESKEFRIGMETADFRSLGQTVISGLREFAASIPGWNIVPDNHEGVRISCGPDNGDGWFLLRLSLHDPVMPLNAESNRAGGVRLMVSQLAGFFDRYPGLRANFS
jgi:phosphomannomutase